VSEDRWRRLLATLEPEAALAAFELRTDPGLPTSLTCDLCVESLTGNLARVAESAQVRARVDSILATKPATSVTAARANGQEAWLQSTALVSRAWAADWKRYSKSQGAEAGRLAASLSNGKGKGKARAGGAGAGDALNGLGAGLGSGAPPPDINASITSEQGGLAVGAQRKRLVTLQDWAFLVGLPGQGLSNAWRWGHLLLTCSVLAGPDLLLSTRSHQALVDERRSWLVESDGGPPRTGGLRAQRARRDQEPQHVTIHFTLPRAAWRAKIRLPPPDPRQERP
jgi:hypothetical protein